MAASSKRTTYRLSTALVVMLTMGLGSCAAPDTASAQASPPPPVMGPPPTPPAANWESPTGPFRVVMEEDPSLPEHTIYRPEAPASGSPVRFPIVAFAGPGCDSNGTAYRPFYTELASHGYLVLASGYPAPRGGSGPEYPKVTPAHLTASLDWAVAENGRVGSKYHGRLDTAAMAVMGQSCGGAQTLVVSGDPRIKTIALWNSGAFQFLQGRGAGPSIPGGGTIQGPPPPRTGPSGIPVPDVDPATLNALRIPVLSVVGGEEDILYAPAKSDIPLYHQAPLFWASTPGDGHGGSFRRPNGGIFAKVAVAWLDWQLKGDERAARMFKGADCTLCADPAWEVHKKNFE